MMDPTTPGSVFELENERRGRSRLAAMKTPCGGVQLPLRESPPVCLPAGHGGFKQSCLSRCVPAFMRMAPPTVPGTPVKTSIPPRFSRAANLRRAAIATPAPTSTRHWSLTQSPCFIPLNPRSRLRTAPRYPSSVQGVRAFFKDHHGTFPSSESRAPREGFFDSGSATDRLVPLLQVVRFDGLPYEYLHPGKSMQCAHSKESIRFICHSPVQFPCCTNRSIASPSRSAASGRPNWRADWTCLKFGLIPEHRPAPLRVSLHSRYFVERSIRPPHRKPPVRWLFDGHWRHGEGDQNGWNSNRSHFRKGRCPRSTNPESAAACCSAMLWRYGQTSASTPSSR